jgi:hypothetical protein
VTSRSFRVLTVALVGVAAVLLAGCPPRERIAKIDRDPGRFAGREITIAGRVTDSYGAMGTGVFQVDDGTGTIWVFSKRQGIPGGGVKVAVSGRVQQGFAFGGRNFAIILIENERRH